jgi:hypothetical protein
MRPSRNLIQVMEFFQDREFVLWFDLKRYAVPQIYTESSDLSSSMKVIEGEGHVEIVREKHKSAEFITMIRLTDIGYEYWVKERKTHTTKNKLTGDDALDAMPCGAAIRTCLHRGCYLAWKCAASPERLDLSGE